MRGIVAVLMLAFLYNGISTYVYRNADGWHVELSEVC